MKFQPYGKKKGTHQKIKRTCKVCKKEFYVWAYKVRLNEGIYCSRKCFNIARQKIKKKCPICSKRFFVYPYIVKKGGGIHCSNKCTGNAKKNVKMPDWWKKKISQGWGGRKEKITRIDGYIFIHTPKHPFVAKSGYVMEHRLVVESQIGRYLTPEEKCHHLGEKDDNRPHLLMAFTNQSVHNRFEHNLFVNPSDIIFDGRNL